MKATIKVEKVVEVKRLEVEASVRYWEDSEVDGIGDTEGTLIPCRISGNWCPVIDVETGQILNWPTGRTAKVHYKVCDSGRYRLKDSDGNVISEIDGYVPECMSPAEPGYGDYIIMAIDANGMIEGWKFTEEDVDFFMGHEG